MPMIDIYATAGTFSDPHSWQKTPPPPSNRSSRCPIFRCSARTLRPSCMNSKAARSRTWTATPIMFASRSSPMRARSTAPKQIAVVRQSDRPRRQGRRRRQPQRADMGSADRGGGRRLGPLGSRPQQRRDRHRRQERDREAQGLSGATSYPSPAKRGEGGRREAMVG